MKYHTTSLDMEFFFFVFFFLISWYKGNPAISWLEGGRSGKTRGVRFDSLADTDLIEICAGWIPDDDLNQSRSLDGSSDENEQFIQRITLMNKDDDVTKGFTMNMASRSRVIVTTGWEKRQCLVTICVRALRLDP